MTAPGGLTVVQEPPQLLVQDLGRYGWAHLGVPPSGALDPAALALANRLVGNLEGAAGLEILRGGCAFDAKGSVRIALTGAQLPLHVDGRPRAWGTAVSVLAGQRIDVGVASVGLRAWLAVAGGIEAPVVLGSRSTDTLSGLGPDPVRAGDQLACVGTAPPPGDGDATPPRHEVGPVVLHVRMGPRVDEITPDALRRFLAEEFVATPESNRVGIRLRGAGGGLERRHGDELASEGIVTGAVQLPSGGEPLIFLADHPVTGGYPVIAVVDRDDLGRCAQLRPGDHVRFTETRGQSPAPPAAPAP
jgi:biotin-dependent carboxylase-like uncharacterized protein